MISKFVPFNLNLTKKIFYTSRMWEEGRIFFYVLGAPKASGILSILYFLLFMNMIGTPGTFKRKLNKKRMQQGIRIMIVMKITICALSKVQRKV